MPGCFPYSNKDLTSYYFFIYICGREEGMHLCRWTYRIMRKKLMRAPSIAGHFQEHGSLDGLEIPGVGRRVRGRPARSRVGSR